MLYFSIILTGMSRSAQVHRTYDNGAPGNKFCCIVIQYSNQSTEVNDVCVHPNQGELISCDQAGCIKQWDLSENLCSHELVWTSNLRYIYLVDSSLDPCRRCSNPVRQPGVGWFVFGSWKQQGGFLLVSMWCYA